MRIKEVISHILGETMGTVITAVQAVLTTKMGHLLTLKKLCKLINKNRLHTRICD
tara:strand:+ start:550 stop:714 length:165 start_codon:yes stop_codon:yes gene_type:complete